MNRYSLCLALAIVLLVGAGCGEITGPTPTMLDVEAAQLAATKRHPYKTWSLERASRVFIRELACLPQVHGRTYPFLGFNWWVTESGAVVVDNVWYPSPAQDARLKQGDLILAVNNWDLHPWVPRFDAYIQGTHDIFDGILLLGRSGRPRARPILAFTPAELLVAMLLDFKHIAMEARSTYLSGPVELLIQRDERKFPVKLYPQHLPAEYAVMLATTDRTINAYAMSGRVILSQRMVNFCLNDDELALVVGHELAHQAQGHLVRGAGFQVMGEMLGEMVTGFVSLSSRQLLRWRTSRVNPEVQDVTRRAVVSVYSQDDEREADAYGLWYAFQAGYDLDKALAVLDRLSAMRRDPFESTYFLDSHPPPLERLARLQKVAKYFQAGRAAEVFLPTPGLDREPRK